MQERGRSMSQRLSATPDCQQQRRFQETPLRNQSSQQRGSYQGKQTQMYKQASVDDVKSTTAEGLLHERTNSMGNKNQLDVPGMRDRTTSCPPKSLKLTKTLLSTVHADVHNNSDSLC